MNTNRIKIALFILLFIAAATALCVLLCFPRAPHRLAEIAPHPPALATRSIPAPDPGARPDWNTCHGGSTLCGASSETFPESLVPYWRFMAGAPVRQTPVICNNCIFFATARGEILAIDFNGQKRWSKELFTGEIQNGDPVRERIEAPLACFNGLLLAGSMRGLLYAFDAISGNLRWQTQIAGPIFASPNFLPADDSGSGGEGRVFALARGTGELHCLDPVTGAILWRAESIERCDGPPAVSRDAVVFGSCAAALHVFSPLTGKLIRNIPIDPDSQVAGGVALDGQRAFSGSRSGKILQADLQTGNLLWTYNGHDAEAFFTPALNAECVVLAYEDGIIAALDRQKGTLQWRFDTKAYPSSPVIVGDKVVFAADGALFLLRLADGEKLWKQQVSDEITAPAVTRECIVVGCEDGTAAAFGPARN